MDRETVEDRLAAGETEVLSPADGDDAYAVPLSYIYDGGDSILLPLGEVEGSEKVAYIESTGRASVVVYEYASPRTPGTSW